MLTRAWFLLSVSWAALLVFTLNWSQLDSGEVKRMIFIALLPFLAGLALKRATRYIIQGR